MATIRRATKEKVLSIINIGIEKSSPTSKVHIEVWESAHLNDMLYDTFESEQMTQVVRSNATLYEAKRLVGKTEKIGRS